MASSTKLVCIELPGQVQPALKAIKRRTKSVYTLLALTPHVEHELDKLGREYRRPEDYHSEEEINAVGLEDESVLNQFCNLVDRFLQSRWKLLKEEDIRPAELDWYYLKSLFNSVSIRTFIMRRVLEEERPQKILYFGTREEPIRRDLYFVRESVWAGVIPATSNAVGIPTESLGEETDPSALNWCPVTRHSGPKREIRSVARQILGVSGTRLLRAGQTRAKLVQERLLSPVLKISPNSLPTLLALDRTHNLRHLFGHIECGNTFNILHWDAGQYLPKRYVNGHRRYINPFTKADIPSKSALRDQGGQLWLSIRAMPEFRSLLRFRAVDCFPVMQRRIEHFFAFDLAEIMSTYLKARILMQADRPCAVLASTMGDYGGQAVALASKREGIPFVIYQHGASRSFVHMESALSAAWEHTNLQPADYLLCFGEGDVRYSQRHRKRSATAIPVGSAALDHLKKSTPSVARNRLLRKFGLSPDKPTVMYVPNHMCGNIRVAPYHSPSASRSYRLQKEFLKVFSEFPQIQFVLKLQDERLNPCSPIAQLTLEQHLENCTVITEPFVSLLHMADMFISDYPSTSFLEMLTTDRPILFCGEFLTQRWAPGKWHPSVLEMWKERVAYADDLEEFLKMLRIYLREERFQPVQSSNTLLKLFGTHLDDGNSAQRAHDFLKSLVPQMVKIA